MYSFQLSVEWYGSTVIKYAVSKTSGPGRAQCQIESCLTYLPRTPASTLDPLHDRSAWAAYAVPRSTPAHDIQHQHKRRSTSDACSTRARSRTYDMHHHAARRGVRSAVAERYPRHSMQDMRPLHTHIHVHLSHSWRRTSVSANREGGGARERKGMGADCKQAPLKRHPRDCDAPRTARGPTLNGVHCRPPAASA